MIENPRDKQLNLDMREDPLSRDSFLGDDQRDIKEIIADDAAILAEAGIAAVKIAEKCVLSHRQAWDAGVKNVRLVHTQSR